MINYEDFSSEAKQAIEHLRKFFLKVNDQDIYYCIGKDGNGLPVKVPYGIFSCNQIVIRDISTIIDVVILTFGVTNIEVHKIYQLAKSKNYWLNV